jgi:selenophosphate synthase
MIVVDIIQRLYLGEFFMTDPRNIIELKERLKKRFGDRYLEFMSDLNNITYTGTKIRQKWGVYPATVATWIDILGYKSFDTKIEMCRQYKLQKKIRDRQETMRQMLAIIARRKT